MKRIPSLALLAALTLGSAHAADKDDPLYAGYACQQYALKQLKTLGNAKSEAPIAAPAKDGRWAGTPEVWHATGSLNSQARFGGTAVRSDYVCTVQKMANGRWTLLDLHWTQGKP